MKCLLLTLLTSTFTALAAADWQLVWADEFNTNGAPDPANWVAEKGFLRNHEAQWYQPENAFCTNGLLVIEARREQKPNPLFQPGSRDWRKKRPQIEYTSSSLTTRGRHEFTYGKFSARIRIDTRLGSWPAFWTLGADPALKWPANGEVDIMEYYRRTLLANVGWQKNQKIHWRAARKPLADFTRTNANWMHEFHVWTMEWDTNQIELSLDGQLLNRLPLTHADHADHGNPFHRPVFLILNQAIGGDNGGDPAATAFPIRMEVDWVRVYQRRPRYLICASPFSGASDHR